MSLSCLAALLFLAAAQADPFQENVRSSEPQAAVEQARQFHVPPGFEVQLVAAEPDIPKPMNLAFDAQGRIWVSGSIEYPYAAEEGKGRDSVKVLADTDGDGRADRITTFVEGLNIPMGVYPYRDGAVIYSIDRIDFWRDTDGDGRADRRETLFGPLGRPVDTHGMQNSFRRGLDGWLYINHGFANETTLRARDGSQITLHSGNTYRIRLDGSRVEQFTWGQVNPFGSDWTEMGDLITADCHSKPLTLLLRGAYYSSFGKPHDGLGFAPELMSHLHGSTGLAGVAYYADGSWPDEYRNSLFVGNVVTSRVHRDRLKFDGATASAEEQPDFVTCDDPWFRPVDLRFGPDGALYIADFYNRIIGHYEVPLEHPGRDRFRARIWRVVYRGSHDASPAAADGLTPTSLASATIDELIAALDQPLLVRAMLALDQLTDRCGAASIEPLRKAATLPERSPDDWQRRALTRWGLFRLGELSDDEIASLASDSSPLARMHAMRMAAELPGLSDELWRLALAGLADPDANVRRAAADAIGQHPDSSFVTPLVRQLSVDGDDAALQHTLRIALRNQLREPAIFAQVLQQTWSSDELDRLVQIACAVPSHEAAQFVLEYLARLVDDADRDRAPKALSELLAHAARHVSPEQVDRLVPIARQLAGDDLQLSAALYQTVTAGSQGQGSPSASGAVAAWGRELVERLIDDVQMSDGDWTITSGGNPWGFEVRRAEDGQADNYLSSLPGGEREISQLQSPAFPAPAHLSFYLCGHRGDPQTVETPAGNEAEPQPDRLPADTWIQLRRVADGQIIRRAFPPRSDSARRIEWDLSPWQGEPVVLELVDHLDAPAYAWLAVGRFQPDVPGLPRRAPRQLAECQRLAAELIVSSAEASRREVLETWVRDAVDWQSRSAAAVALARLDRHPIWQVVGELIAVPALPTRLRREIADQFTAGDEARLSELLVMIFQHLTQPQQELLAHHLATSRSGAERLLELIEQGKVSGQLLQRASLRQTLSAAGLGEVDARIERLVSGLPPEDDQLAEALKQALASFEPSPGAAARGKAVFSKHCSACHQVAGEGQLVGPQLDGIGNRGLERIAEDVLAPYRNVDVAFRTTILSMVDGRVLSGLVRDRTGQRWVLVNSEGKEIPVDAGQIDEHHTSPYSIMPENFRQVLTPAELNDLLAFLAGLR